MLFEDALKLMREGKKVRLLDWAKGNFIFVKEDMIFDECAEWYSFAGSELLSYKWVEFEEPTKEVVRKDWFCIQCGIKLCTDGKCQVWSHVNIGDPLWCSQKCKSKFGKKYFSNTIIDKEAYSQWDDLLIKNSVILDMYEQIKKRKVG